MNESQSKIDTNLNRWKDHFDGRAEALGRSPLANDHFTHRSFTITQRIVLEQIEGQQGKTILDIGCGNGLFMQPLLDSYHVYGIDISDKMCALSRSVGYREVLHNDCENIGFDKDFFDVTVSVGIFQYLHAADQAVAEMARVTKPGGLVMAMTLNEESLLRKFFGGKGYIREYKVAHLFDLFEQNQLGDREVFPLFLPSGWTYRARNPSLLSRILMVNYIMKAVKHRDL